MDDALRALIAPPATDLHLIAWTDPVLAETGHGPMTPYVELFWLPILGPSATWLLRRIEYRRWAGVSDVSLHELAMELGVGRPGYRGLNGALAGGFKRLVHFSIAAARSEGLAVRTHVPHLRPEQLSRLPLSLQKVHPPLAGLKKRSA